MAPETYDLIVIGSGPAGEKGAAQAAYFGKRVALIEKESKPGGAAANTGTLPSKTLRETALFLSGFRHRQLEGLDFRGVKDRVSVRDFMAREKLVVSREHDRINLNLERHKVDVYPGAATFLDPNTVTVRGAEGKTRLKGHVFLIATGSYPFRPRGFEFNHDRIFDSDEILGLKEIPQSMLVVGGGVIGCEYASIFATLGVKATLIEKRGRLIGSLDSELSAALQAQMEAIGVQTVLNDQVKEVKDEGSVFTVTLDSGKTLSVETVLVSSGRCGSTDSLGLDKVGIQVEERGRIPVNEHYQTIVPHVYAAGDVIGFPALASTAMQQGRIAMVHAFGLEYLTSLSQILPYGIYTIPECSMAGETEESLQQQGIPYVVGRAKYASNARGQIIGDSDGFLKLIFHEEDMRLLGCHMIGEQATELIHVGLSALLMQAGADLFIHTCYNYPTLTELYKYATYDALGNRQKKRAAANPQS